MPPSLVGGGEGVMSLGAAILSVVMSLGGVVKGGGSMKVGSVKGERGVL